MTKYCFKLKISIYPTNTCPTYIFLFDKVNENEGLINQCESAYEHFVTQKIIHLSVLINVLISRRNRRLSRPQITYFRPKIWFRRKKKKKKK